MKNETTRTKTLSGFSSRAVALVLCFVSVLSAIAAGFEGNGASVLLDAAKAGADVDAPADAAAADDKADAAAEDEAPLAKKADSDLADTGRDADIAQSGYYYDGGNYYFKGDLNGWNDSVLKGSGSGRDKTFIVYITGSSTDWNEKFIFVEKDGDGNNSDIKAGDGHEQMGTTGTQVYVNGGKDMYINRKSLGTQSLYKVTITLQTNDKIWCWYSAEGKNALSTTLTTKKGSTSTDSFELGDTVNLSANASNSFGTASYTYEYKIGSGSYQSISGDSFVPPETGTYTIRVTAKDDDVIAGTNARANRTATQTTTITVSPKEYYYLWVGDKAEFNSSTKAADLKRNATTGKYEGTYTFNNTNWHSLIVSSSSSSRDKVWNQYSDVGWSLDTYNSGTATSNQSDYKKTDDFAASDALSWIEICKNGDFHGLKAGARAANTTFNITYDPTTKVLAFSAGEVTAATIYAKDGAINNSSTSQTYASIANTRIYKEDGSTAAGTNTTVTGEQSYETYTAKKGETVVIKTTVGHSATGSNLTSPTAATLRAKYYVRGFCINGEVPQLLSPDTSTGVYTLTYTVPEDYEGGAIEITPIYYLVDTTTNPVVTFRVNGFTDNLKEVGAGKPNWGNTLYAYPFYGKLGGYNNAFGSYPGQPLVYNNGQYQIQIPTKSTAWAYDSIADNTKGATNITEVRATPVSGVTMSNGYYDNVHRTIMGYGDDSTSTDHVQTYDYGDFYKIQQEHDPDNIVFDFKYETNKHNLTDQITGTTSVSDLTSKYGDTNGNGFELLKNYHAALNGNTANPEITDPVYVVSIGGIDTTNQVGVENIAGYYATEWIVYAKDGSSYKRITNGKTSIPPEVLLLKDNTSASFSTTKYPSAVAEGSSSTYNYAITDWQPLYTTLEAYRNHPVYISYEKAATQLGAKNHSSEVGTGGATRNDGRWLYSSKGENISSNIRIDVSDDNGVTYKDNSTLAPPVTGLSAYFTNTEAYGEQTYATTIDADKTFDFEASTTNASYMFVGWYFDNGIKITTDNVGHTERSGSYTLVARFMKVTAGQLIMQHSTNTDNTYKGAGTSKIAVQVTDSEDKVLATYPSADTITIPKKYITNTHLDYKIKVTLTSTPSGYDTYGTTSLDTTDSNVTTAKFFSSPTTTTSGGVTTKTFSFTVSDLYSGSDQIVNSLLYNSYYNKTVFNYDITFSYTGRKIGTETADRSYKRSGTLTPAQVTSYLTKSGSTYTLSQDFITTLAPHESNFNETLVWTLGDVTSTSTTFTESYTASVPTTGTNIRSAARTATFDMGKGDATVNYNVTFGQLIKNGDNYITADPMYNGQYFQYWLIQTDNADASKRVEVAKCYSNKFNYLAYDNYYITAVYASSPFSYGSDGASATISYLDTTRNQWNNSGNGGYTTSVVARDKASDLLFNDFALSYGYNGQRLYENNNAVSGKDVEVGFIVERVRTMDIKQDGSYDTDVSKYTASGSDATTAKTNATNAINNITVSGYGAAGGTGSYKTYTKYKLDRTKLDNKNRIEFFYALYNAYGGGSDGSGTGTDGVYWKNYTYKNYVYRAYSYIKVGNELTVTDNPAYFIMYEEATK